MEERIKLAQKILIEEKLDGWLLYDFGRKNDLAYLFLQIPKETMCTRRFFYWVPKKGNPIKVVHAVESFVLDHLPGERKIYFSREELRKILQKILKGSKKVAMEYSFQGEIPYVSKVDGGTIDWIRSFQVEVESSQNILPYFTAVLTPNEIKTHKKAAKDVDQIVALTWKWIGERLKKKKETTEYDIQQKIVEEFEKRNLQTVDAPICAFNENSANPHYSPVKRGSKKLGRGDFVLIDLWAKEKKERSVFADITRVFVADTKPSVKQEKIFQCVKLARDTAIDFLRKRTMQKKEIRGFEVDQVCRNVIEKKGFGKYFLHKTGHSIEFSLHGSGAHLDSVETKDGRRLLPSTCFSIEPGIYLPKEFGVRLELDILLTEKNKVEVTGGIQEKIGTILS